MQTLNANSISTRSDGEVNRANPKFVQKKKDKLVRACKIVRRMQRHIIPSVDIRAFHGYRANVAQTQIAYQQDTNGMEKLSMHRASGSREIREYPLTALCVVACGGLLCRIVQVWVTWASKITFKNSQLCSIKMKGSHAP